MVKMRAERTLFVLFLVEFVTYTECAVSFTQPTQVPPAYEDKFVKEGEDAKLVWTYSVTNRNELDLTDAVTWSTFIPQLTTDPSNNKKLIVERRDGTRRTLSTIPSYLTGRISIENQATLVIRNVKTTDDNFYECVLTTTSLANPAVTSLIRLTVISVNIVEHPKSAICQTFGGEVNFTCNATGTPHPNITWVKSGKELVESSSVKIVRDGKGYSKLTIKNCEREAVLARYWCKATNPLDLEVSSKSAVLFSDFIVNDTALVDKYSSPSNVTGAIGVETTLRCAFRSYPPPSIHWTIPNGVSRQTALPFLIVKPMSSKEFGNYTCSAEGFPTRTMRLMEEETDIPITTLEGRFVVLTWPKEERAKYYTVTSTEEGLGEPFLAVAGNNTYKMTLRWESEVTKTGNKGKLKFSLEVRALANSLNKVMNRFQVTLVSRARFLEAGFLAIVVASAFGLLSAGFQ